MKQHLMFAVVMMAAGVLFAQTTDSITQAKLDSIDAKMKMQQLKAISISAPKPVYSMTGEVVNYNVENDETVRDLTAWDAIRNAPTVQVDEEGNLTMRGSEQVEVWLNGRHTGMPWSDIDLAVIIPELWNDYKQKSNPCGLLNCCGPSWARTKDPLIMSQLL